MKKVQQWQRKSLFGRKQLNILAVMLLSLVVSFMFLGAGILAFADNNLDPTGLQYGFEIDTRYMKKIKWTTRTVFPTNNGTRIGNLKLSVGKFQSVTAKSNGNYVYGVMIYAEVNPQRFTATATDGSGKTQDFRSRSKGLKITSSLSSGKTLTDSYPKTGVIDDVTYEYLSKEELKYDPKDARSYSMNYNNGICAFDPVIFNRHSLDIENNSSSSQLSMEYNYTRHLWPWEWERTYYCWEPSLQRMAYYVEAPSGFSTKLDVELTFAVDGPEEEMWNFDYGLDIISTFSISI